MAEPTESDVRLWIADLDFRDVQANGFGASPEKAVAALLAVTRGLAPVEGEAPLDVSDGACRENISVSEVRRGRRIPHARGDDARFDGLFAPKAVAASPAVAVRESAIGGAMTESMDAYSETYSILAR